MTDWEAEAKNLRDELTVKYLRWCIFNRKIKEWNYNYERYLIAERNRIFPEMEGDIFEYDRIAKDKQWSSKIQRIDLSENDLQREELYEVDLREAKLRKAILQETKLQGAKLQGAILQRADLREAEVQGAKLQGAILQRADLRKAKLQRAILQGADLREAKLQGAILQEAELQGVKLYKAELQDTDLWNAKLQGVNLEGIDLHNAKLSGANLQRVTISNKNLQDIILRDVNLEYVKLQRSNLMGANLERAKLQGAKLEGANLQNAKLLGADLQGTDLQGANLQNARLRGANLQNAKLLGADLRGASLQNTKLQGTKLQNTKLQGADFSYAIVSDGTIIISEYKGKDSVSLPKSLSDAEWTSLRNNHRNKCKEYSDKRKEYWNEFHKDWNKRLLDDYPQIRYDASIFYKANYRTFHKTNFTGVGIDNCRINPKLKTQLKANIREIQWTKWYLTYPDLLQAPIRLFWALSDYGRSTIRIIVTFVAWNVGCGIIYFFFNGWFTFFAQPSTQNYGIIETILQSFVLAFNTIGTLSLSQGLCAGALAFIAVHIVINYCILAALVSRFSTMMQDTNP